MSEISTLCDICGKIAGHTCKLCGKRVCSTHYEDKLGICTSCKAGRKI